MEIKRREIWKNQEFEIEWICLIICFKKLIENWLLFQHGLLFNERECAQMSKDMQVLFDFTNLVMCL